MILQSSALSILLIGAVICLPPFLMLRLFSRSLRRAQRRDRPSMRFLAALVLAVLAFVFNLGVLANLGWAMSKGAVEFGNLHWAALGVAWIALWVWIFFGLALSRSSGRKRGLR